MQRKRYAESRDNPDVRITCETAKADKVENNPVRVGIGVGGCDPTRSVHRDAGFSGTDHIRAVTRT